MIHQRDEIFFSQRIETIFKPKSASFCWTSSQSRNQCGTKERDRLHFLQFLNWADYSVHKRYSFKKLRDKTIDWLGLSLQGQNILFQCPRYSYDIMVVPSGRLSAAIRRTAVPKSFPLFHVLDASRFKFDLYTTAHSGTSFCHSLLDVKC